MSRLDSLLKVLSEAPTAEIPAELTKRLKGLIGCSDEIVSTELQEIVELKRCSAFAQKLLKEAIIVANTRD